MSKWYYHTVKEFAVKNGFEPHFTDDHIDAIRNARMQSEHVNHVVYVDDVDGNCMARCYRGFIELTAAV